MTIIMWRMQQMEFRSSSPPHRMIISQQMHYSREFSLPQTSQCGNYVLFICGTTAMEW